MSLLKDKHLMKTLSVKALFDYNPEILIEYARVLNTTESTARVEWQADTPLSEVIISLEGREDIRLPGDSKSYVFTGLIKNSRYAVTLTFISEQGTSKSLALEINTSKKEEVEASKETLVGVTW